MSVKSLQFFSGFLASVIAKLSSNYYILKIIKETLVHLTGPRIAKQTRMCTRAIKLLARIMFFGTITNTNFIFDWLQTEAQAPCLVCFYHPLLSTISSGLRLLINRLQGNSRVVVIINKVHVIYCMVSTIVVDNSISIGLGLRLSFSSPRDELALSLVLGAWAF